jgi:hypothetical protein
VAPPKLSATARNIGGARGPATLPGRDSPSAAAHSLGQSYAFLRVHDDSLVVRLEITVDDLNRALQLGWSAGHRPTRTEVAAHLDGILSYVRPRLEITADGHEIPLHFTGFDVRNIEIAEYVLLRFVTTPGPVPQVIEIAYPVLFDVDANHRNLLVIEHNWRTTTFNNESVVSLIFSPDRPRQTLDLASRSTFSGFAGFIRLGMHHIWVGLDHIFFLIALILPSVLRRREDGWEPVDGFRPALFAVVAVVTSFTVAHSVTLSLAALDLVRLPERLVEATIAASIGAAALYNLFPRMAVREWMIAFVFGLFHGFGFANVLADIGLERGFLALSLLGFNLGVEIGQVAIVAAIFPALFLVRTHPVYRPALRYASMALIAVALFWFAERASDVPLTRYLVRAPAYVYRQLMASI